jgi:hypothetical protein
LIRAELERAHFSGVRSDRYKRERSGRVVRAPDKDQSSWQASQTGFKNSTLMQWQSLVLEFWIVAPLKSKKIHMNLYIWSQHCILFKHNCTIGPLLYFHQAPLLSLWSMSSYLLGYEVSYEATTFLYTQNWGVQSLLRFLMQRFL